MYPSAGLYKFETRARFMQLTNKKKNFDEGDFLICSQNEVKRMWMTHKEDTHSRMHIYKEGTQI